MSENDPDRILPKKSTAPDKDTKPQDPVDPVAAGSSASQVGVKDISIDAALSEDAVKDDKIRPQLEKKYMLWGGIGIALLVILMTVYSCQPNKGSIAYGICSTLLEMKTQYPHTIRHINVEGSRTTIRIYYTSIDAFGQYKMEMFECKFGADNTMGMRITDINHNRQRVPQAEIDNANKILPSIIASDPYRVAPPEWKNPLLH